MVGPTCECSECRKCKQRAYMRLWRSRQSVERRSALATGDREKSRARKHRQYRKDRGNPEWQKRQNARRRVANEIRAGRLVKQPCEVCETTEAVHAHHVDYSQPLDVRWLCKDHHVHEHHPTPYRGEQ